MPASAPVPPGYPPASGWPGPAQWPRLAAYLLRALAELALARWRLARLDLASVLARNPHEGADAGPRHPRDAKALAWIAYAVPRMARRLPFRSDCLVQALAAQRWLATLGLAGRIVLGVEKPDGGAFGAHAWLVCGGMVVTGGSDGRPEARYTPLL